MDQREDQSQKRIFNKKQFMKTTLQFVILVSLFSIFFWCASGFSIHPQSFNAYFSTSLFSMFTHTLERKYMFLVCNGILAFIAKSSLMSSSAPILSDSDFDQLHASNLSETKAPVYDDDMVVVPLGSFQSPEKVPLVAETEEEEVEWQEEYCEEVSEEQEEGTMYTQNEAFTAEEEEIKLKGIIDEGGGTESEVKVAQNDDYDDDELAETTMATSEELANTDELNRKFEEFIRKMKEEMRIVAQRQLIAV